MQVHQKLYWIICAVGLSIPVFVLVAFLWNNHVLNQNQLEYFDKNGDGCINNSTYYGDCEKKWLRKKTDFCFSLFMRKKNQQRLNEVMKSIRAQFGEWSWEVYLLFDGATNVETAKQPEYLCNNIRVLHHDRSLILKEQITVARLLLFNKIMLDDCRFYVELHDDTFFLTPFTKRMVENFNQSAFSMYTPWLIMDKQFCKNGDYQSCQEAFDTLRSKEYKDRAKGYTTAPCHMENSLVTHPWIIKMEYLRQYGLYDPEIHPQNLEDTDFVRRGTDIKESSFFYSDSEYVCFHPSGKTRKLSDQDNQTPGAVKVYKNKLKCYSTEVNWCKPNLTSKSRLSSDHCLTKCPV